MKKTFLAAAAALALTAGVAHAAPKNFDGFYVGAEIGGAVAGTENLGADFYGNGFTGGIFGGYGATFNDFYVGAELNGSITNLDTDFGNASLKKKHGYGIAARLGYLFAPSTLGYGVVGWERGRFELSSNGVDDSAWVDGLKVGAGLEYALDRNLSVRGELAFINWDKKDVGTKSHEIDAKVGVAYHF